MNGLERQQALNARVEERYSLASDRVRQIPQGRLLSLCCDVLERVLSSKEDTRSIEERQAENDQLYREVLAENYGKSLINPQVAIERLGKERGEMAALLGADFIGCIPYAFRGQKYQLTLFLELFIQIYTELEDGFDLDVVRDDICSFYHDNCAVFAADRVYDSIDPSMDCHKRIVMESDFSDIRYLYDYGIRIGKNEIKLAEFIGTLPAEDIDSMAKTLTEGFFRGFEVMRKDVTKKRTARVEFPVGLERVTREVVKNLAGRGITALIGSEPTLSFFGIGGRKYEVYGNSLNPQFEFDHRNDKGFYFDKKIAKRMLEAREKAFEELSSMAKDYAGPLLTEVFGMEGSEPVKKPEALSLSEKQRRVNVWYRGESQRLSEKFIPSVEGSYTIVSYPLPSIGDDFEKIFAETVKVNTLPYQLYRSMQQLLIDVLDRGRAVHIKGKAPNETDIVISLHELSDGQTNFENCVADVNIPVGEVFTSPVLKGTTGVLNVSGVYLNSLFYRNLRLEIEDGMVRDYTCGNFEKEEDNKKLILENILFFHDSLPVGEFAIGTNTTAYVMAKSYGILGKLPILIAEKCGPHFALGDTCYSYEEDNSVFNPDGKEMIARENEVSALRHEDASKAYFSCHTDITIPYEEIQVIEVIMADGSKEPVIEDGRFVVPGTEKLNEPLDAGEKEDGSWQQ